MKIYSAVVVYTSTHRWAWWRAFIIKLRWLQLANQGTYFQFWFPGNLGYTSYPDIQFDIPLLVPQWQCITQIWNNCVITSSWRCNIGWTGTDACGIISKVSHIVRPNKICVFTICRPTQIFGPDPKLFYDTFNRKLFEYPIFAFQCSFWCWRDHYFDQNVLKVTVQV